MALKDPVARAAYNKAYREKNADIIKAQKKAYKEENLAYVRELEKAARERHKEYMVDYTKTYREDNKEYIANRSKAYLNSNKESIALQRKGYREANKEKLADISKERYRNNATTYREKAKKHYIKNKNVIRVRQAEYYKTPKGRGLKIAAEAKRHAAKIQRTPTWLSKLDKWMIDEIYMLSALRTELTGVEWQVDHIIPLQGKKVSGLHIPFNLQVITAKENQIKSNRLEV